MAQQDNPPDYIRTAYGLAVPQMAHPRMRRLKDAHAPTEHGFKRWNATWILLDFLSGIDWPPQPRVLDAGCGWGLAGIYCARQHNARVTAVDIDPQVRPYLAFHAELNAVSVEWIEAGFEQIQASRLQGLDLLIGADICFDAVLIEPLYGLLERAVHAGVDRIALADPGRSPFLRLARRCTRRLGAQLRRWETTEPTLDWAGAPLQLQGHLLLIGDEQA